MKSSVQRTLESVPSPLTPYDILAYLLPASTFFLLIYLFEFWCREKEIFPEEILHTPLWTAVGMLFPSGENWVDSTVFFLFAVGVTYVAGHLIASISSLVLDRVFISKGYGYPFSSLLNLDRTSSRRSDLDGYYYRGIFFWVNGYILLRFIETLLIDPTLRIPVVSFLLEDPASVIGRAADLIGWWILIFMVLKLAAEKWGIDPAKDKAPAMRPRVVSSLAFLHKPMTLIRKAVVQAVKGYSFFYDKVAAGLARYVYTRESFDESFQHKFKTFFSQKFRYSSKVADTNNFWFAYMYILTNSPELTRLATNWFRLYSFVRNLSTSFYLAFIYAFSWLWWYSSEFAGRKQYDLEVLLWGTLSVLVLSFLLLIRYYYLYVSYFSRFVFRSFVFICEQER